jgi:MurNAc alpha-1-phosphate uridylyltransferase
MASRAPDAAFVLAAGLGTRMRPLTDATAKALLPVAGRTLLDRALDRAIEGGARRAVVNVHHCADQVEAHLAGRAAPEIAISDERAALLETGGGAQKALPLLGAAPFYALNSDAVWTGPAPLPALSAAWDPARMDALMLLVPRERARGYTRPGDFFLGEDGRPRRRGGSATAPQVYTGAQILAPAAFAAAPGGAFSMNVIWDRLLEAGRLFAVVHGGGWVDVGTPAGLDAAEAAVREDAG